MNVTLIFYILWIAILAFILGYMVSNVVRKTKGHSGTMKVFRDENKILYSLELNEDPIILEQKNEVVFKVDTSDQSSDRK